MPPINAGAPASVRRAAAAVPPVDARAAARAVGGRRDHGRPRAVLPRPPRRRRQRQRRPLCPKCPILLRGRSITLIAFNVKLCLNLLVCV